MYPQNLQHRKMIMNDNYVNILSSKYNINLLILYMVLKVRVDKAGKNYIRYRKKKYIVPPRLRNASENKLLKWLITQIVKQKKKKKIKKKVKEQINKEQMNHAIAYPN